MGTLIKSLSLNDNNMTSFLFSFGKKTFRMQYDSATNQKEARCLTDLSVQMFVVLLFEEISRSPVRLKGDDEIVTDSCFCACQSKQEESK